MGLKKVPSASPLAKKVRNMIEFKEIVEIYESGVCLAELARMYGKSKSTICSILAKEVEIKEAEVANG